MENMDGMLSPKKVRKHGKVAQSNNSCWEQIFGTFNSVAFIFTLFLPETKGLSLEQMDVLFKVVNEDVRRKDVGEHVVVPHDGSEKSTNAETVREV